MPGGPLEQETCRDVILPAIAAAGWEPEQIHEQFPVRAERAATLGRVRKDLGRGFVDYVLEVAQAPVAVVEAKRSYRSAADGMQQAIRYAQQIDAPLAYATNGEQILERDMVTGHERVVDAFAPPSEAWARYAALQQLGVDEGALLRQEFNRNKRTARNDVQQVRWYQSVAVRRVLAAIARGERRVLLLMATGTGKTFTAVQIVHMLREHARQATPDRNYRVLYLADRDELVDAPQRKDFTIAFGQGPLRRVSGEADRRREIYFATYQALAMGDDADVLFRDYPTDFFDLVIVDECHRGSASENSSWRRILDHFEPAVQLGLTATPKQDDTVDTYGYFGEPVFTYSLRRGIEDGYLAPYRVRRVTLSPDADGWEPDPGQVDRFGRDIPEGRYSTRDFERTVRLLARTDLAADYISRILRADPGARTVVFCYDQQHATDMRVALVNANPDLVAADPEWVVRIVGDEEEKKRLLQAFCDPDRNSPVVATTSRLLSTGVDIEDLKYVVLFRPIGSAVEFKQIIGRGTRLYPDKGKTFFEIIDFVGATSHFADPDFDGYPARIIHDPPLEGEAVEELDGFDAAGDVEVVVAEPEPSFTPTQPDVGVTSNPDDGAETSVGRRRPYIVGEGSFEVLSESLFVPDTSTGRLRLTEYGQFVAGQIRRISPTQDDLAARWARKPTRDDVLAELAAANVAIDTLTPTDKDEVDLLDVLVHLAWNVPSRTRAERVRRVRQEHHADLEARSDVARLLLSLLLDRYAAHGIDELTSPELLTVPEVAALGTARELAGEFGGVDGYHRAVDELQDWIYSTRTAG